MLDHQGKLILLIHQKNTSVCLLMKIQYAVSTLRQTCSNENGVAGFQNVMLEEMIAFLSLNIAMV